MYSYIDFQSSLFFEVEQICDMGTYYCRKLLCLSCILYTSAHHLGTLLIYICFDCDVILSDNTLLSIYNKYN